MNDYRLVTVATGKKTEHPLYTTWIMMRQRCDNPKAVGYKNYGGRGIRVCERWHDFDLFVEDVGEKPSQLHTLDRFPNKDGNYEPKNFRWATAKEQQRNASFNHKLFYNGCERTISDWSEITGIRHDTISRRLKMGWSINDALSGEVRETERIVEHNGESLTIKQWASKLNLPVRTINTRYYKGWSLDKVLSPIKMRG